MKIPKGMTEQEVLDVIDKVANRYANKYKFGFYDSEDIKQEAFIIALEGLEKYDNKRPLENFLAVHVKNRLNNLKRDKYYRQAPPSTGESEVDIRREERNNSKKHLMYPLDIHNVRDEQEKNMKLDDSFIEDVSTQELFTLIDDELSPSMRGDYLRIKYGVYVSKPRREKLCSEIKKIIEENEE